MNNTNNNASSYTQVFAWGSDNAGQMGLASKSTGKNYTKPRFCSFNIVIHSISCGDEHSAFIASNGYIYTMGSNLDGRLGISSRNLKYSASPCLVESLSRHQALKVSCGGGHTAALMETGQIYTWGNGSEGQLGLGTLSNHHSPQLVKFLHPQTNNPLEIFCVDIECGAQHTGAITDRGDLYMFGSGSHGQLGTGRLEKEILPCKIELYSHVASISCGFQHTLLLTEHSKVYACGNNSSGQLGTGSHKSSSIFQKVTFSISDLNIKKIAANKYSAAVSDTGDLYLWGSGTFGEYLQPQKIALEKSNPLMDLALGDDFGCAIDITGTVYSWGNNQHGELGVGDCEPRRKPTVIGTLEDKKVVTIACGGKFCIALGITVNAKEDGTQQGYSKAAESSNTSDHRKRLSVPTRERPKEIQKSDSHYIKERRTEVPGDRSSHEMNEGPKYRGSFYLERPKKEFEEERNKSMIYEEHGNKEGNKGKSQNPYFKLMIDMWREGKLPGDAKKMIDEKVNKSMIETQERSKRYRKQGVNLSLEGSEQEPTRERGMKERDSGNRTMVMTTEKSFQQQKEKEKESRKGNRKRKEEDGQDVESGNNTEKRTGKGGQDSVEMLRRENAMLKESVEDLRRQVREYERGHGDESGKQQDKVLQRRYEKLEREYSMVEKELQMKRETVEELKVSVEEERRNNQRYLKDLEEQRAITLMLEVEMRNLQDKNGGGGGKKFGEGEKELRKRNEELQKTIARSTEEFNGVIREKEEEIAGLERKALAMQEAIEKMDEALKRANREDKSQKELIGRLEKENEDMKKRIKGLEVKLGDTQARLQHKEESDMTAREHHEKMIEIYEKKFAAKDEELMDLKSTVEGLITKIEELEKENKGMRQLVEAMDEALQSKIEESNNVQRKGEDRGEYNKIESVPRRTVEKGYEANGSEDVLENRDLGQGVKRRQRGQSIGQRPEGLKALEIQTSDKEAGLTEELLFGKNVKEEREYKDAVGNKERKRSVEKEQENRGQYKEEEKGGRMLGSPIMQYISYTSPPGQEMNASLRDQYEEQREMMARKGYQKGFLREYEEDERDIRDSNEDIGEGNEDNGPQSNLQEQINKSAAKIIQLLGLPPKKEEGQGQKEERVKSGNMLYERDVNRSMKLAGTGEVSLGSNEPEVRGSSGFDTGDFVSKERKSFAETQEALQNIKSHVNAMGFTLGDRAAKLMREGGKENLDSETRSEGVNGSNLNELRNKLQDLQKNKLALEQRMQDFERKLKESKNK